MEPIFTDEYFMQRALQEAQLAFDKGEVPVGAVVVAQDRIIARAHNLTEQLTDVTAHAEMQAITAAAHYLGGKYLQGCTLYVTLEPCLMCAGALYWSQISKLVFAAPDPKRGSISIFSEGFQHHTLGEYKHHSPLHPKTELKGGVLEVPAAQLLQDFFSKKRK